MVAYFLCALSYDWECKVDTNVSRMMHFLQESVDTSTRSRQVMKSSKPQKTQHLAFTDELRTLKNRRNRCIRGSQQWKLLNSDFRRALRKANKESWIRTQETFSKNWPEYGNFFAEWALANCLHAAYMTRMKLHVISLHFTKSTRN